jgi:hypothetical protein
MANQNLKEIFDLKLVFENKSGSLKKILCTYGFTRAALEV